MATGSLDVNGIWQYGEDDQRDTFSALLNIGQATTSDSMGTTRARLANLEQGAGLGPVTTGAFVAATGWTLLANQARKKAGLVFYRVRFSRSGAAITVPTGGDVPNQVVATIAAGWLPASGMVYAAVALEAGPVASGVLIEAPPWNVTLAAVSHAVVIGTGAEFTLGGVYPLA